MSQIIETGITWEHDTGTIVISTRSKKVANRLRRLGLNPDGPSKDYLTFRTDESKLSIIFRQSRKGVGRGVPPFAPKPRSEPSVSGP